jgi:hypothetical protein
MAHSKVHNTTLIPTDYPYGTGPTNIRLAEHNEYVIKGHMLVASLALSEADLALTPKDEIKKKLAYLLAADLIDKGCIDYTQGHDWTNNSVMIRARAFAVSDTDVQLLRTLKT